MSRPLRAHFLFAWGAFVQSAVGLSEVMSLEELLSPIGENRELISANVRGLRRARRDGGAATTGKDRRLYSQEKCRRSSRDTTLTGTIFKAWFPPTVVELFSSRVLWTCERRSSNHVWGKATAVESMMFPSSRLSRSLLVAPRIIPLT